MKKNILIIILALLSSFALSSDLGFNIIVSTIIGISLLYFYNKNIDKIRINGWVLSLSIVFSIFMIIGNSFKMTESFVYLSDNWIIALVSLFGYTIFFNIMLNYVYDLFLNNKVKDIFPKNKLTNYIKEHPFKSTFIFLFICYLPYIIVYYPVILNPDGGYQIQEVMGIPTWYLDSVVLPENYTNITNFNPVIHTLLLGGLFKFGHIIGNDNFGLFLYTLVQVTIVIGIFAYTISYMYKNNFNKKIIYFSLLSIAFIPVFPNYAITGVKDVIFSALILLYVVRIYDFIKKSSSTKDIIILTLISILIVLFRNNGFYTILLSLPFLLLLKKKMLGIVISFLFVTSFYYSFNKVILPYYNVPNTSIREVLSIPFQQIARLSKYHPEKISDEDKLVIDKILEFDTLKDRYKPSIVDPVKNKFNKNYTNEDLSNFFSVWYKYLSKHPITYLNATFNTTYGYFYPNTTNWYLYTKMNKELQEKGLDYHFNSLDPVREVFRGIGNYYSSLPIIGLTVNIGFNIWVLFIMAMMYIVNKKKELLLLLLPAFTIFLACIVGPVNSYFRYVLPIVYSMPFMINVLYNELNKRKK